MPWRTEEQNLQTQPPSQHPVFNNWEVVTEGWYIVCSSKELGINQVLTRDIAGQKVCVYRDSKGQVHGLDGFCPHMGVDLGIGSVVNDRVRCFFHHWEYDHEGKCRNIPIQTEIPKRACLQAYAICEKYELIWIHPDKHTQTSVLDVPALEGLDVCVVHGKPYYRKCHYHITMINGIDPQHLRTVHNIHIDMALKIEQASPNVIDIELTGPMPASNWKEKLAKKIMGDTYSYAMKYADGCVAALTTFKGVHFFGKKGILPELYMIFAYQMVEPGKTRVNTIFITRKRAGLWGAIVSKICLAMTQLSLKALQGEDGQIYENIRFSTRNLLAIDAPVAKYIKYINQLKPSCWSRQTVLPGTLKSETGEQELPLNPRDFSPLNVAPPIEN